MRRVSHLGSRSFIHLGISGRKASPIRFFGCDRSGNPGVVGNIITKLVIAVVSLPHQAASILFSIHSLLWTTFLMSTRGF